jgi:superfamily I DNA/RNA helicase/mRNA-degrading endonuclease RelE of RelBE toxin-antitoxin system
MEFRIADTFMASLAKLGNEEQKAAKTTVFDLQVNPANPGFSYHKLDKVRDKNFRSVRVNDDIRLIVHQTQSGLLLCYIDHHDKAYAWAERRKLETHPKTGAAQFVEIRQTVREIIKPQYCETPSTGPLPKSPLFAGLSDDELLGYGVPAEWLDDVRQVDEDTLLELVDHLPEEAAEALLELATGGKPESVILTGSVPNPFHHPDARRRFRVIDNIEELERALDFPWEKWSIFLHPAQRQWVEQDYSGPARVSGSAGTGKTIVSLHRAVYLARSNPDSRVLLTTFSTTLANSLRSRLRCLISNRPRLGERIEVYPLNALGKRLYELNFSRNPIASSQDLRELIAEAAGAVSGHKFSLNFLLSEWTQVVDAWQLETWEEYRDVRRLGRKTRLSEQQRMMLWSIFSTVRSRLKARDMVTYAGMFLQLSRQITERNNPPFDFAVVDESQDLSIPQLRFLAALGAQNPNALFFAGDLGQRIFQQPFSWKAVGVDLRGRSRTLRINYRTSHQIRLQADRLVEPEVADVDGNTEDRRGTVSVFNGPPPVIRVAHRTGDEILMVGQWLKERCQGGVRPHEIAIFVRSAAQLNRAGEAVQKAKLKFKKLDEYIETTNDYVSILTMPLAKGLEFRAVVVMACDDEVIPLQERIETVSDDANLEEVYNTERHLLYVACTRARDYLLVTAAAPESEFLDDLRM